MPTGRLGSHQQSLAKRAKHTGTPPRGGLAASVSGQSNGIEGVSLNASFTSSAQTGYDSNAQIAYTFTHAGYACGTNHDPPKAAIVVMRGTKS